MAKSDTTDKILQLLKAHGPMTAQDLAAKLSITSMGSRQHLQALEEGGLVSTFDKALQRGRPKRFWQLTDKANERFPDRHSDLTLNIIESVKTIFGDEGLDKLITDRELRAEQIYLQKLDHCQSLEEKVSMLADIRSEEGYMAQYQKDDDGLWLLENHCPICAAAATCQNFCRSELALFQKLLGENVRIERTEHIIEGARRCAYHITAK